MLIDHRKRRFPFRRTGRQGHAAADRQTVAVLHKRVAHETQLALTAIALAVQPGKHLVLCRIEQRPPRLDLDVYPYLPRARVTTTAAASYMSLLSDAAP